MRRSAGACAWAMAMALATAACAGSPDPQPSPPAELFVGSSSIRFWRTLAQDFPDRTVLNRGFGGSTVWEVVHYFDRVVAPYRPKEIVFYAENDLARDRTPEQMYADFVAFMEKKEAILGATPVWFIAVKPSKLRWDKQPQMTEVNRRVEALARRRDDLAFINVVPAMLGPDGQPKDIYVADNLHMNGAGYALWTPLVDAALDAGQRARAPGC